MCRPGTGIVDIKKKLGWIKHKHTTHIVCLYSPHSFNSIDHADKNMDMYKIKHTQYRGGQACRNQRWDSAV